MCHTFCSCVCSRLIIQHYCLSYSSPQCLSLAPLQPPFHPEVQGVYVLQQQRRVTCLLFVPWVVPPKRPPQGSVLGGMLAAA